MIAPQIVIVRRRRRVEYFGFVIFCKAVEVRVLGEFAMGIQELNHEIH